VAGSNLSLGHLHNVDPSADTAVTGKVLGTTATGAWGPIDPPTAAADHNVDEVVYAMTANAGIWPWGSNTWGPGSYVMYDDRLWYTAETAPSSEVPGVSPLWQDVTLAPDALDSLKDVTAPTDTPAGKVLGTTADGQWGPVDPPAGGLDLANSQVYEWTPEFAMYFESPGLIHYDGALWTVPVDTDWQAGQTPDNMPDTAQVDLGAMLGGAGDGESARAAIYALAQSQTFVPGPADPSLGWPILPLPDDLTDIGDYHGYLFLYPGESGVDMYQLIDNTGTVEAPWDTPEKWARITLGSGDATLDSLTDVVAPADTPVGKVLGTTAVGEWGPVDFPEPPSGLPPLTAGNPVTLGGQWTHTRINGVNAGRGQTGRICLYDDAAFQISTHDAAGVDRSAEIESLMVKGAVVTCTYGTTSEPLTLTGPIERRKDGLSDADFYFASVTGGQSTDPADDQAVVVTVVAPPPADGSILTLAGGAPTWAEPAGGGATADHNIDEVVYAMTANAGIWPWGGNTWGPGSYVMHNDRLWYTAETAPASEVPGVSPLWRDVTLSESPPEVAVGPTEPTDPSVLLWVKTTEA
jgi:hypothetical protein